MIRVAAVGDVHVGPECTGQLRPSYAGLADHADVLLLAGDLTRCGEPAEIDVLCRELDDVGVPVVAVLGNHDHHAGYPAELTQRLGEAGIHVLDGSSVVRLLDNLEAAGLIQRREESEDRRAKAIVLTPRGRATAEQVEMVARKIRNDALAGLSDQEIEIAHRVLDHVCVFLNAAVEEPAA